VRISLIFTILLATLLSFNSNAQRETSIYKGDLIGESIDLAAGIHTGFFNSNHAGLPFNIGIIGQFNYTPDVRNNWFLGIESGFFYTTSGEDKYYRKTNDVFIDFSIYPGIIIKFKSKAHSGKKEKLDDIKTLRKLKIGLGLTVTGPIRKRSEGSRVNNDAIKPGFGFSLRTSYDLKYRLSLYGSIARINRDLDGYSNENSGSIHPSDDNKYNVTYIYKLGILWTLFKS